MGEFRMGLISLYDVLDANEAIAEIQAEEQRREEELQRKGMT